MTVETTPPEAIEKEQKPTLQQLLEDLRTAYQDENGNILPQKEAEQKTKKIAGLFLTEADRLLSTSATKRNDREVDNITTTIRTSINDVIKGIETRDNMLRINSLSLLRPIANALNPSPAAKKAIQAPQA